MEIKLLCIGDIVGPDSVNYVCRRLLRLRSETGAVAVVANGENAAAGNGLDTLSAKNLLSAGVDVITGGNHTWHRREIRDLLENSEQVLRPANYPPECPGSGSTVINVCGYRLLVINLLGTVFMDPLDCPFRCADRILEREKGRYDISVVDMHAEATSEKIAVARYLDGRISAVFGTHTHVATADERILPGGTGFITDIGMTGPSDSILGIKNEIIIEKFMKKMPVRFENAQGVIELNGALFTLDTDTGRTVAVERVCVKQPD